MGAQRQYSLAATADFADSCQIDDVAPVDAHEAKRDKLSLYVAHSMYRCPYAPSICHKPNIVTDRLCIPDLLW